MTDEQIVEAADSAAIKAFPEKKSYSTVVERVVDYNAIDRKNYRDGFIAGSGWKYQKDRGEFAKIKAKTWCEGFDAHKEQMMKEAVEGEVVKDINNKLAVTAKINLDGFKFGDKVKVIVIKED